MWAWRRFEAARRFTELSHRAAAARADAYEARLVAADARDDAESRSSIERSAATMDEAAAELERIAERYLAMSRGERTAADVDDVDDSAWDGAPDAYELAASGAYPPIGRALRRVRALDGMGSQDVRIDDVVYTGEGSLLRLWPPSTRQDQYVVLRVDDDGARLTDRDRRPMSDSEAAMRLQLSEDTMAESRAVLVPAMVESQQIFTTALERHEAADFRHLQPAADGEEDVSC
jgi:hypothetical protein